MEIQKMNLRLEKTLNTIDGEYVEETLWLRNRLEGDVVVGLFGDVTSSDLQTMNKIIQTLHLVAPQLNISYSNNSYFVNLPIHFLHQLLRHQKIMYQLG